MSRKFLTAIDMQQNEIQNLVHANLATPPSSPKSGQVYYSSSLSTSLIYNGSAWVPIDASKLSGVIPMSAMTVDPTARANHTGTQVSSTISDLSTTVKGYPLNTFATPTASVAMGGYNITGLATPTAAGHAAEYSWVIGQVQSAASGITSKDPVQVVATSNLSLTGLQTIDGVTVTAGQRVLATGQTTASQNGVYIAATTAWVRSTVEGTTGELDAGATWLVLSGTTYAAYLFRMSTTGAITVGTTSITIVPFSIGTPYTVGSNAGLTLTANTFSVQTAASSGILVNASGVVTDTTIISQKRASTITGDGSTVSFAVAHNLAGGLDVSVQVYDISTGSTVETDVTRTSATVVTLGFATAPVSAKTYRVLITG